ncbi:uncharacterized protein N7483_012565 [Penicillium malachiteum]|uniref:uncharacterized protein n=1 Tax=Penicillium malachiteum TaxID=1324776 RepID=UPI00254681A3|nr:uncharacterized protein N7483_012565 [Penicillium malachiteum]KAJ5715384.1 hypothetical protein N7483_012565 [Penicillium malachiteum]
MRLFTGIARAFQLLSTIVVLGLSVSLARAQGHGSVPAQTGYAALAGALGVLVSLVGIAALFVENLSGIIAWALDAFASVALLVGGILHTVVRSGANPFPSRVPKDARGVKPKAKTATDSPTRDEAVTVTDKSIRDQIIIAKSLERDHDKCLVSKRGQPTLESVHIVPFRFNKSDMSKRSIFQTYFTVWWGSEWADKLESLLQSDDSVINTEFTANMMTLSPGVYAYWSYPLIVCPSPGLY